MSRYYEQAPHLMAAGIALTVLDVAAVGLKFWTRWNYKQAFQTDDWLLVPATVVMVGMGFAITYGAARGALGTPLYIPEDYDGPIISMETDQITLARTIQYAFLMMHPVAVGFARLSFLFLYRRIFTLKKFRGVIIGMIVLVSSWIIAFFFAEMFQCRTNWEANWGTTLVFVTQCNETRNILAAVCLSGFILDVMIMIIPLPFIWQLRLDTRKKIGLTAIFMLGAGTVVASLIRYLLGNPRILERVTDTQRFGALSTSIYWGTVEAGVGIFVATLSTLQQIIRKHVTTFRSQYNTERSGTSNISGSNAWRLASQSSRKGVRIQVDQSIDINFTHKDDNPILAGTETWVQHSNRSDEGSHDIELQTGLKKQASPTEL